MRCPACKHVWAEDLKTDAQLAYFHGPVMKALTEYWNRTRDPIFPVHPSVVFLEIKKSVLGVDSEGNVLKSRNLTTRDYAKMTDDARDFLATKGIHIPSADEPWEQS